MLSPFLKFERGRRYRVTLEGIGENDYSLRVGGATVRFGPISDRTKITVEELPPAAPRWRPGDVIAVKFGDTTREFTYVRGMRGWPAESRPLTDGDVDRLWVVKRVRPLLQAEGQPFDTKRIYGR